MLDRQLTLAAAIVISLVGGQDGFSDPLAEKILIRILDSLYEEYELEKFAA